MKDRLNALQYVATLINKVNQLRPYVDMTSDEFFNYNNSPQLTDQQSTFIEIKELLNDILIQTKAAYDSIDSLK